MTGDELKAWRLRNGAISQKRLAEMTERSAAIISYYENNLKPIPRVFELALMTLEKNAHFAGENDGYSENSTRS